MVEDRFGRARKARAREKTGSSYTGSSRGGFTETKQVGDRYRAEEAAVGTKKAQQRFMDRGRSQYQDVRTDGGVSKLVSPTKDVEGDADVEGGITTITPDIDTSKYSTAIINKIFSQLTPEQAALVKKLRGQGKSDASILMKLKQSKFADENLINLLSGEVIKKLIMGKHSLFKKPEYEHDFLGSAGAGNVLRKLEKLIPIDVKKQFPGLTGSELQAKIDQERQNFINDTIAKNPEGAKEMFGPELTGKETVDYDIFRNTLVGVNLGNKSFDKAYDPESYYSIHQPQSGLGIEQLSKLDASLYPDIANKIFAAREQTQRDREQGRMSGQRVYGGGGGGGGGGADPTDPTQPTTVPDYVLKQQYMPGFTPSYTGGPEQMQIAGGYWDPRTQKWIDGGGPWGTQSQYQFPPPQLTAMAQGGIVGTNPTLFANQGGMVNDKGIMGFKKYGY